MFFGGGFPFEEMGGMPGGMPGGMGGGRPQKAVNTTEYYERLGVEKSATMAELKKAYHKLAMKHHPDRGGDKEKFQEIQTAYEALSDKDKRDIYDKHGEEGLSEGGGRGGGAGGFADIFEMFGGGGRGGGGRQQPGKQKKDPVVHPLKVTLEEIMSGKATKISVNRERLCAKCEGKGGKEGAVKKCGGCNGRGQVNKMQMLGPGMYSQTRGACDDCRGTGEIINEADKCKTCNGKKVNKEKKILEAAIDKGAPNNQQYTFHGEADEFPGCEPGDVIIVVKEQPHKRFKRKGADLLMEKEITLLQALTGVDFVVNHLDGTKLRIKNEPGQVIKPDDIKTVFDKGLPFHKQSYKFGNLYVMFKITFPKEMPKPALEACAIALGAQKSKQDEDMSGAEVVALEGYSEQQRNTNATGGQGRGDSDEEEEGGPRGPGGERVQCAQQ